MSRVERYVMDHECVYTLFLDSLNRVPSHSTHGGDQTENIWISRFAGFPGVLLHWWGTVYSRENLFEILGTPEKTCLICIGTPAKTCWRFWHSQLRPICSVCGESLPKTCLPKTCLPKTLFRVHLTDMKCKDTKCTVSIQKRLVQKPFCIWGGYD